MSKVSRVKGTQDFLDLELYNFIIDKVRDHLVVYHFTEIATPILEHTALFTRSLGEHTDVVSKEMFTITTEHDDNLICLRPEATASIARAFTENGVAITPWKVFTHGPMFRHERPQRGRYREFHQIDMEIIGSVSVAQDVHLIKMLDRLFHEQFQIQEYALLINFLGCASDRIAYEVILRKFLDSLAGSLCDTCVVRKEKNILRIFDCKNPTCQSLYVDAPYITESLCSPCAGEWQQMQDQLSLLSVSFICKPTLVRGLDYYNKTVFEFVSNALGAQSTFCAGGRYDGLVAMIGGKESQPSVGAAIGVERVMMILELSRNTLPLQTLPVLHAVMPLSAKQQALALLVADLLQAAGLTVELLLEGDSLKSMMRKANKMGAGYCLLLGDDEQQENMVTVKNMVNGTEKRIAQVDVVNHLKL